MTLRNARHAHRAISRWGTGSRCAYVNAQRGLLKPGTGKPSPRSIAITCNSTVTASAEKRAGLPINIDVSGTRIIHSYLQNDRRETCYMVARANRSGRISEQAVADAFVLGSRIYIDVEIELMSTSRARDKRNKFPRPANRTSVRGYCNFRLVRELGVDSATISA